MTVAKNAYSAHFQRGVTGGQYHAHINRNWAGACRAGPALWTRNHDDFGGGVEFAGPGWGLPAVWTVGFSMEADSDALFDWRAFARVGCGLPIYEMVCTSFLEMRVRPDAVGNRGAHFRRSVEFLWSSFVLAVSIAAG